MKNSQTNLLLNDLLVGDRITPIDALNRYGCFRLSARINDLRKEGFNILTNTIEVNKKRVAQYYLKP